jgi:hypothetical protein
MMPIAAQMILMLMVLFEMWLQRVVCLGSGVVPKKATHMLHSSRLHATMLCMQSWRLLVVVVPQRWVELLWEHDTTAAIERWMQKAIVPREQPAVVAGVATWLKTLNVAVPDGGDGEDDDEWNS